MGASQTGEVGGGRKSGSAHQYNVNAVLRMTKGDPVTVPEGSRVYVVTSEIELWV